MSQRVMYTDRKKNYRTEIQRLFIKEDNRIKNETENVQKKDDKRNNKTVNILFEWIHEM